MVNGKLVDENILLMAEMLATNSKQMQENMGAVSECGSKSEIFISESHFSCFGSYLRVKSFFGQTANF